MSDKNSLGLPLDEIALALAPYGAKISDQQLTAIRTYTSKLIFWNQSVNLTALTDPLEIVARHFGESIFAASVLPLQFGRLADVGSGAGFPGLPLKIAFPGLGVVLLESNIKKCAFLAEIQRTLSLEQVEIVRSRYEEFPAEPNTFDFICSRALGDYRRLLRWAQRTLKKDGRMVLWLGTDDSILIGRTKGWIWDLPARIPESKRRVLLVGRLLP